MKTGYLAMVLGLISSAAMADSQIGSVVQPEFTGATGTRTVSSAALEELHFNRDVFAGETVKTPANGSTVIKFQDQTQIQVGHDFTIVLDSFVYDPQTATSTGTIAFSRRLSLHQRHGRRQGRRAQHADHHHGHPGQADLSASATTAAPMSASSTVRGGEALRRREPGHPNQGQAVRVSAACNGAEHMPLAEVPVDATVASDFDAPSPAQNGAALANHQSSLSNGALGGSAHEVTPGDPDRDGDKDRPGED